MTKAISDVDDCVEGMRKFTTEVFDTGVALVGYAVMLLAYDWRLAILSLLFTPVSYVCAAWMKRHGPARGRRLQKGRRRVKHRHAGPGRRTPPPTAFTAARPPARPGTRHALDHLREDRRPQQRVAIGSAAAVSGGVRSGACCSFCGSVPKTCWAPGGSAWDIAAFTTFLSCFTKLTAKSSQSSEAVQRSAESRSLLEAHSNR